MGNTGIKPVDLFCEPIKFPGMNLTLFAQIIGLLPKENFKNIVEKLKSHKHSKGFNS